MSTTDVCPDPNCKKIISLSEHKIIGVHFQKVTDVKPCPMSYQPFKKESK